MRESRTLPVFFSNTKVFKKIIQNILTSFNLEIKRKNHFLNTVFFSKKKIDIKVIEDIFCFHKKINPLYENLTLPDSLRISKTYKSWFKKDKAEQINLIKKNNIKEYKSRIDTLISNDFNFIKNKNEYTNKKFIFQTHFNDVFFIYEAVTGRKIEDLSDNNTWSKFGYKTKKGIISSEDLHSGLQAHNIFSLIDFLNLEKKKNNLTILDLGCGIGRTAEKILYFKSKKNINLNLILIDLPLRLTLAYAYLKKIFPKKKIFLISNKNEIKKISLFKGEKILLIPSIYSKQTSLEFKIDILHNQASLSEMNYSAVSMYLNYFVNKNLNFFVETNFNNKNYSNTFLGEAKQIFSRDFPVPKTHKLLISFSRVGAPKYVTKIYKKI